MPIGPLGGPTYRPSVGIIYKSRFQLCQYIRYGEDFSFTDSPSDSPNRPSPDWWGSQESNSSFWPPGRRWMNCVSRHWGKELFCSPWEIPCIPSKAQNITSIFQNSLPPYRKHTMPDPILDKTRTKAGQNEDDSVTIGQNKDKKRIKQSHYVDNSVAFTKNIIWSIEYSILEPNFCGQDGWRCTPFK